MCSSRSTVAHSLRARVLAWVLLPLAVVVAIDARIGFVAAEETATMFQDRLLAGSARTIAETLRFEDGAFQTEVPPAAIELFQSGGVDRIYYRVDTPGHELLIGYADLPTDPGGIPGATPRFVTTTMRGEAVRMAVLVQPVVTPNGSVPLAVEVAQTMRGHRQLLRSLWLRTVGPPLLILLLATALIAFGLRRGLRPITQLRDAMTSRPAGTLEPLALASAPSELAPLVDGLNDTIRRLDQHVSAQRTFIENAAHQLRTPLAVLGTQAAAASRAEDEVAREQSLAAIRQTVGHAGRLVSQLLTLSIADARPPRTTPPDVVNLNDMARMALENVAARAQAREIDLGFEQSGPESIIHADPVMVREVLFNLLDNAIRYTPPGGVVTVRLTENQAGTELIVEDNGPGIPEPLRALVFERFFRIDNQDSGGAGLGLAIVRQFVERMGASVELKTPAHGSGVAVVVRWTHAGPLASTGSCGR